MKWRLVDRTKIQQPTSGDYTKWKPLLSKEAKGQCVYCCITESQFGGMRNFHVEHFKPQSRFPELTNEYTNLFYACGVCNVFKSDDWLGDHTAGDYSQPIYPDPSKVNYSDFLFIDRTGNVGSDFVAGRYLIERLHLNRAHMVGLRGLYALLERAEAVVGEISALLDSQSIPDDAKDEVIEAVIGVQKLFARALRAQPYSADQLKAKK